MPEEKVVPEPRCPMCGDADWRDSEDDEGAEFLVCQNCNHQVDKFDAELVAQSAFLTGLEAARDAIRPINDDEESAKVLDAPWERLRVLIDRAKKEIEHGE